MPPMHPPMITKDIATISSDINARRKPSLPKNADRAKPLIIADRRMTASDASPICSDGFSKPISRSDAKAAAKPKINREDKEPRMIAAHKFSLMVFTEKPDLNIKKASE